MVHKALEVDPAVGLGCTFQGLSLCLASARVSCRSTGEEDSSFLLRHREGFQLNVAAFAGVSQMSGIEILQAIVAGKLPHPPMAETMGFRLSAVAAGTAQFECLIGPQLLNPFGTVHGGVALSLIDSAAGCAVHSVLPSQMGYASIETKVNYTRPLRHDSGLVTATGIILSRGNKIATAEAKLHTRDGELVAHGTSTILLLPNVKWSRT